MRTWRKLGAFLKTPKRQSGNMKRGGVSEEVQTAAAVLGGHDNEAEEVA